MLTHRDAFIEGTLPANPQQGFRSFQGSNVRSRGISVPPPLSSWLVWVDWFSFGTTPPGFNNIIGAFLMNYSGQSSQTIDVISGSFFPHPAGFSANEYGFFSDPAGNAEGLSLKFTIDSPFILPGNYPNGFVSTQSAIYLPDSSLSFRVISKDLTQTIEVTPPAFVVAGQIFGGVTPPFVNLHAGLSVPLPINSIALFGRSTPFFLQIIFKNIPYGFRPSSVFWSGN